MGRTGKPASSEAFKRQCLRDLQRKGWRAAAELNGVSQATLSAWKRRSPPPAQFRSAP